MPNSCMLGIHVGESFAEYSLIHSANAIAHKRVYLSRESIKQTLPLFLAENASNTPKQVFVSLRVPKKLLDYQMSGPVAHVITEGFENWLNLIDSQKELTQKDFVFSLRERVLATGEVEKSIDAEDIESIISKLNLIDCKKICLNLLHAENNPQNLNTARELFMAKGFEVFTPSPSVSKAHEFARWNRNALNATAHSVFLDRRKEIIDSLSEVIDDKSIFLLNSQGKALAPSNAEALEGYFSATTAISKVFGKPQGADVLYLGLEEFNLVSAHQQSETWESEWGPVAVLHTAYHTLAVQPTLGLHLNVFGHFDFTSQQEGWEPGPMFLGRGQKLSLLDMWAENSKLQALDGLTDRFSTQGIQRAKNSLFALGKSSRLRNTDVAQMTKEMQSLTLQRLVLETVLNRKSKKMLVTGPLAAVFSNAFKRDPESRIESSDFAASVATALCGAASLEGSL